MNVYDEIYNSAFNDELEKCADFAESVARLQVHRNSPSEIKQQLKDMGTPTAIGGAGGAGIGALIGRAAKRKIGTGAIGTGAALGAISGAGVGSLVGIVRAQRGTMQRFLENSKKD